MRRLEGRRLFLYGVGGAGFSAYALLASAWGAEVSGWDRVPTPYLEPLSEQGIDVLISDEPPAAPAGFEAYVSTAYADRVRGGSRAELLAELVSLQDSIVVSGAHGKTTTTAMIAFCLDRLGRDPAYLIGGEVPQLGANARAGDGWLVVEGDESDRTVESLRPRIAVVTNVDLDHHAEFRSRAELEALFERWLAQVPHVVRGWELPPADVELAVPGEHNRRNAACALAALELAGVDRGDSARVLRDFAGVARRWELKGTVAGVRVYDDYAHNPAKVAATVAAARELGERVLVLFQPHLYSRTRHLARELGAALAGADVACVTEIYAAREAPVAGVSGKAILDSIVETRPGMPAAWTPRLADGVRLLAGQARGGDVVVTMGAGDVDTAAPLLLDELRRRLA